MSFFKPCNTKKVVIIIASIIVILIIVVLIVVLARRKPKKYMPCVIYDNVNKSTIIYNLNNCTYFIHSVKEKEKDEDKDKISFYIEERGKALDCYDCFEKTLKIENINNEEDNKKLLDLFNDVFKNATNNLLYFNNDNLTNEQIGIILSVLENNEFLFELKYEIIENSNNYDSTYKKRGFSYSIENDGSIIYTIAMGEKPTGGYFIKIKKVLTRRKDVVIYIYEKSPGKNELLTQAFTYPITQIKFSNPPTSIKIVNEETGTIYSHAN